ncbi:MAG: lipopolysaccharide kinase InaA family protein [Planctomycetota bacterium]
MPGSKNDTQELQGRTCRWVAADYLREHLDPEAPSGWLKAPFEVVKETSVRRVVRGRIESESLEGAGVEVHIKWFRPARLSDRARDVLTKSRGVHEYRVLERARALGLPAVEPLAAGRLETGDGRRSFLVTRSLDATPLPRRGWSPELAASVGRLLRAVHDKGLHARDLHPGNVLVDQEGSLHLVDLTSSLFTEPLENEERATALAFFCHDLDGHVEDPIAAPLREAYGGSERLWRRARQSGQRLRARMLLSFGRRAFRNCRHTRLETEADRWQLALSDLHPQVWDHSPPDDLEARREAIRAFLGAQPGNGTHDQRHVVRRGRRGGVFETEEFFVKERDAGAARRLLRAAYWLHFASVPTPRPLGMAQRSRRGFVFAERLADPNGRRPNLSEQIESGALDRDTLIRLATDLGQSCGRLHGFGLRCRDLKLENLVVAPRGDESERVFVVDLDGVRRKDLDDPRGEGRDLGRLLAAAQVALPAEVEHLIRRFWRAYFRTRRLLGTPNSTRIRRVTEARAREWHGAHGTAC